MMGSDEPRSAGTSVLSAETLEKLRVAVWQAWTDPEREPEEGPGDGALRHAVAAMAREAHARRLRAEELLVAFKGVLEELSGREGATLRVDGRDFQARLVTLCIRAYYAV